MKVALVMGSISDKEIVKKAAEILKQFAVPYESYVISAHRSIDLAVSYAAQMEEKGIDLTIAFAGKAAHLAGVLAGLSIKPVIGVPVKASTLDGLDALLSTVQMPKGVPVATVAIDGAENAALLAVQILALNNGELKEKLTAYKKEMKNSVLKMNEEIDF